MNLDYRLPRLSAPSPSVVRRQLRARPRLGSHVVFAAVSAAAAMAICLYVFTACHRMRFPFELEWMEGGILEHVQRVLSGKSVYAAPSIDFAAFIYNPFYYYVAAAFCALFGVGLFALRLVSFIASVTSFLAIFLLVTRHTRSHLAGVCASGLFSATFVLSGAWFDLARIDSLGLALLLGAAYPLMSPDEQSQNARARAPVVAGGLIALAILTKQSAALVVPVLLARAYALGRLRGAGLFAAATLLPLGIAMAALHMRSGGWYWYYAFQLPAAHTMSGREALLLDFWRFEMFGSVPIAATTAAIELFWLPLTLSRRNWFLPAFSVTLILVSYVTRLHMGSYTNDLMPAHAGLAMLSSTLLLRLARVGGSAVKPAPVFLAGALQIGLLFYSPASHLPPTGSRAAGVRVVDSLRATPGEVWFVSHPYFNTLAGKPSHIHFMALVDIELATADPRGARAALHRQIDDALTSGRFSQVVLDDDWFFNSGALHDRYLARSEPLLSDEAALWPLTGTHFRPTLVFEKK